MLLQKKGADIWTQRSSKRLKSGKLDAVTAKVSQQDKRKANLEAQRGNMHLQQLKLLQAFLIKKKKVYVSGLVVEIIPSMIKCFQTMCPQNHLTVQSEQLVSSGRALAPQPRAALG